ncbi:MAG TPA: hypothetical protein VKP69_00520 [Isosphaeraceae bacterium]|nr:hypothetical protein [Isosphaeraceae bacterium]
MRRLATIALSLSLVLGLAGTHRLLAQGEEKKEIPKPDTAKPEAPKPDTPKSGATTPSAATEPAPPTIPPDVQAKLEAARRAVAEAIVAAEGAGLVKTSIDPPPILDILVNGYADDESAINALKSGGPVPARVSPEVFGAWFTGYGKDKAVDYVKQVRVTRPEQGLKKFYNARADLLKSHIEAIRKAQGEATPKDEPKMDTKEEAKKEGEKKADNSKGDSEPK